MSFSATGARRPLQSKPRQNPFLKRSSSSFSNHARTKPTSTPPPTKRVKVQHDCDDERLHHGEIVTTFAPKGVSQDVVCLMKHAREHMFDPIPERAPGMSSTRIAEVLNFRRDLAPIVSLAHLHAMSVSPTNTDREIAKLTADGTVRRITIPGRGRGGAPLGDGLILTSDWTTLLDRHSDTLPPELRGKYLALLTSVPTSTIPAASFAPDETSLLIRSGFLTSTSALRFSPSSSSMQISSRACPSHPFFGLAPVADAGTTAPTGSLEAVGGAGAVHLRGGGSGGLPGAFSLSPSSSSASASAGSLTFSVPGTAAYLRLLADAIAHLVQLVVRSSPRHKEGPMGLLGERWEGNTILAGDKSSGPRAEWAGGAGVVLPGRTKKWKSFYGMRFRWVVEEGLGSGVVEAFETGTVGLGIRVVR